MLCILVGHNLRKFHFQSVQTSTSFERRVDIHLNSIYFEISSSEDGRSFCIFSSELTGHDLTISLIVGKQPPQTVPASVCLHTSTTLQGKVSLIWVQLIALHEHTIILNLNMARRAGLEPTSNGFGIRCFSLNYRRILYHLTTAICLSSN